MTMDEVDVSDYHKDCIVNFFSSLKSKPLIDAKKLTLEEWLNLLFQEREAYFIDGCFPTNEQANEYVASINNRSNYEVYSLIKLFLVPSTTSVFDEMKFPDLVAELQKHEDPLNWLANKPYYMRLLVWYEDRNKPVWEGITWVLELLPEHPKKAINVIENYLIAHFWMLPDSFISGLYDAIKVIRAKFIGVSETSGDKVKFLLELDSRQFEHLIKSLYTRMGYKTELTSATRDGGRDVIAIRDMTGQKEKIAIECKLYTHAVGVEIVRSLRGVVAYESFNRGVLFTTHRFSEPAEKLSKSDDIIELVSGEQLVVLLNENFGIDWTLNLERIVLNSEDEQRKSLIT
jgi:restriction system protein